MPNKKHILSVLLSIIALVGFAENPLVTETIFQRNDSNFRDIFYYDSNHNLVLRTRYIQTNEKWLKKSQTEYTYQDGKCTYQDGRIWENNDWIDNYQIAYVYDMDNLILKTISKRLGTALIPDVRTQYEYSSEKIAKATTEKYINDIWEKSIQTVFTYDMNQNIKTLQNTQFQDQIEKSTTKATYTYEADTLRKIVNTKRVKGNWENVSKTVYYHNRDKELTSEIGFVWNAEKDKWNYNQNIYYQYKNNKLVGEQYQYWSGLFWENNIVYTYHYDSNGALLNKQTHYPIYKDFMPANNILYSDFEYNKAKRIESSYDFWGGDKGTLSDNFITYQFNDQTVVQYASSINISYTPVRDTSVPTNTIGDSMSLIKIYPNPSNGMFYFNSEIDNVQHWHVTSLNGQILKTQQVLKRSGVVDITDLENGIYLLYVVTDNGIKTQKLIKQ